MIKVPNLTKKQKMFCEILWKFDYQDQIQTFIDSLPTKDKNDATVAYNMMIAHVLDDVIEIETASSLWKDLRAKWDES